MQVTPGFEDVERDFYDYFEFLNTYKFHTYDHRGNGSFLSITMTNGVLNFRIYFEFIYETLIVSIVRIGENFETTTFQMNKLMDFGYDEEDLKPKGDNYKRSFELNAAIVRKYLDSLQMPSRSNL